MEEQLTVRKHLLQIITNYGEKIIPIVVKRLENPKWYVVRNMLVLLRDLKAKEALPQIVACMKNPSSKVKISALQALGEMGPDTEHFFHGLTQSLVDEDDKIFRTGISFLFVSRHPRTMNMVTNFLKTTKKGSDSLSRKQAILIAIGKSGGEEWIPILQALKHRLAMRFWNWGHQRILRNAIVKVLLELNGRGIQPNC